MFVLPAENTSFGAELLSKQIAAVIKKLNSPELKKQKKAFRVLDSLATSGTLHFVRHNGGGPAKL
jgi:hypothetical protein